MTVDYGVRCTMTDGEQTLITTPAESPEDAIRQVESHRRIFGGNDGAGRWLASQRPQISEIHEAKPVEEWDQ